ncbi:hypothetical protein VTJ83DRAFT_406 [Remersonia thermophila]|uniref:DUF7732 domain-containing protein n=1 Tax=Remersonia thermophila TaxID=72144 RepID=A0ABR4DLJ5_9PEZI
MRLSQILLFASALVNAAGALDAPAVAEAAVHRPAARSPQAKRDETSALLAPPEAINDLVKRKGGGGGGGRGGGGRGGGGSSSGSSSSGRTSPNSNVGGRTTTGTGPQPRYGGGRYYGGGAVVPYKSGNRSPSGIAPVFAGAALLAFWPGVWLYGAYMYHWPHHHTFYNETSEQEESKPVSCACDPYLVCSCDFTDDTAYLADLIGNGSFHALDHAVITVATVNGTSTILLNGTLPNGTTAAGGDEEPDNAAGGLRALLVHAGWWPVVAAVAAIALTTA